MRILAGLARLGALGLMPLLSGCVAAALPLVLAGAGATAFSGYKLVQTTSGGSVSVGFPGKDGKETPPTPIAPVRRVAVWPGDEGDVRFAGLLQASGKFAVVTPPSVTTTILTETKTPLRLKDLTDQQQVEAFDLVCRRARTEFVFASRALGLETNENFWSFSRANVTNKVDLLGFSCEKRAVVWRDRLALVIEAGGKVPTDEELNEIAAKAWADRIFVAMGDTTQTARQP